VVKERSCSVTGSFAGWLSAKGVLEACSLLIVVPSFSRKVVMVWSALAFTLMGGEET